MFELFRLWLVVLGAGLAAGGVVLALFAGNSIAEPLHSLIDRAFWPQGAGPDAPTRQFRTFVYGVVGGTLAGFGLMTALLASQAFSSRESWVWWTIAGSVVLWFVVDTGRSLRHRVYVNAAANSALLVLVAIPLAGTFGEFH